MALTVGTDSYVTLAEAVAYLGRRLRTSAWDGADTPTREKALRHAVLLLQALPWAGDKHDADQALAFPRGSDDVPQAIQDAQCELALAMLAYRPPIRHVLKGPATPKDGAKTPLTVLDAEEAAHRMRGVIGPEGGTVLVLDGDLDYDVAGETYERPDLAQCGATFHDLPPIVQNLIGDYVALGVRLSR